MDLPFDKTSISHKMPATTRSTTRSFHAAANAIADAAPPNNNKKWSSKDHRTLLRMCRQMDLMPETMAAVLGRSEEAIRYRLANIVHEHLDGRKDQASIKEVSDWILPNY
jgi:hypothetical protein